MIVDLLVDYWKSKSKINIYTKKEKYINNALQTGQQETSSTGENRGTGQHLRYAFEYYIKYNIMVTKQQKKHVKKIENKRIGNNLINLGKWFIGMYVHIHYTCLTILCFLSNQWVNKIVLRKYNKQNIIVNILKPFCTILKLVLEHRIFVIEFDFFNQVENSKNINASPQTPKTKNKPKTKIIKRTVGRLASEDIKIISINIAGKLEEKVEQIKKLLDVKDPDILCLQETHTYTESFKFIQGWFKNKTYDLIYCSESQKKRYEETKKKEIKIIEEDETLSTFKKERLINQWQSNTMLYNLKYKGGMLLFIKKNIRNEFVEVSMIPNSRGISIMSTKIDERYNTYIHFIYGPSNTAEALEFWSTTENIMNKKTGINKHFIVGDLNIQMEKQDSNSGNKIKLPKSFKNIIRVHTLLDAYKLKNKRDRPYTYFQVQNDKEVKSRLDYTLVPTSMEHVWHSPEIYAINKKISCDHKPIGITLKTQITREYINKITEIKQKKMVVKEIKEKDKDKIIEIGNKVFSTQKWNELLTKSHTNKQININSILEEYEKDIWIVAEEVLQIKEVSNIPKLKPKQMSDLKKENLTNRNIVVRAILSIANAMKINKITKKIEKLYTNLRGNKYKIATTINLEKEQSYTDLKKELQDTLKELRVENESINKRETSEFIKKRVDEIKGLRVTDPGRFFAKAQPDSVFSSQQLWTVDYEEIKITPEGAVKVITTTSVPEIVARKVKEAWETIFTSKRKQNSYEHAVFCTKKFKEIKSKIKNKDQALTQETTKKELEQIINNLSNGTAPGPDNIPNEIIKILYKTEHFSNVMTKIINICLMKKQIPERWKKSHIYTIHKKDNPNNPLNYRPIALICTTYKIYSSLITKRLSDFMEKNDAFSNIQGGFRRDRPTFAKIWTLKNIIEHSMMYNKEIHMCYIDIQKAYDSVEYWALDLILEKYGFNKNFRDIIHDICENTTCNVILPYGLSDNIKISRGVRQGDPLSPILFIMFLEPLMLQIEESNRGYDLNDGLSPIPGGAYADDMVLHANTNKELQFMLNEVINFFEYVGLQIAYDTRDKSVYTNNTSGIDKLYIDEKDQYNNVIRKYLPYYSKEESYKYLGVWMNLSLNWNAQISASNFVYNKYITYLYKKCFNATQTVEILNLVVFPTITYRMNIIWFPEKIITKWDKVAKNLIAYKLRENQYLGSNQWFLPYKWYGFNLFKLKDLQKICVIPNFINYAANFIDKYSAQSTAAIFHEGEMKELATYILKKYRLEMYENPEHYEHTSEKQINKFIMNKMMMHKLLEASIENIDELLDDIVLKDKDELEEEFDIKMTKTSYNNLKKEICKPNSNEVLDNILKRINRYPEWNMDDCFFNEVEEAYEIYVDETEKNNMAGYGIFCNHNSQNNYYSRVEGEQTLQNATYQGILHVLKGVPKNQAINFIIDRKAVIDIFNKLPNTYKDRQDTLHLDTLIQIEEILKERTAKIQFKHCYSHIKDVSVMDSAEKVNSKAKKLTKLIEMFGEESAYRYIEGNKQADKLADKIHDTPITKTPNITKYHNKYIIKSNRKKTTVKGDKDQIINTRVRKTLKDIVRKEYSEGVWQKEKYDNIKKYKDNISKMSTDILRDKDPARESGRKMMMRMLHGTLPTCEKIDRLVQIEKNSAYNSTFYTDKYDKHTNEGLCPCCFQEKETVRHLFFECESPKITEIRENLELQINKAINKHVEDVSISTKFIGTHTLNNKINWDNYLASLGLIPTETINELKTILNEEQLPKLKWIIVDMINYIMDVNIEIWKFRCKCLYSDSQTVS